jgi:hypothetical protein
MFNWFDPRTTGVWVVLSGVALASLFRVRLRMISSISPQRLLAVIALGALGGLGQDLSALALSAWVARS